MSAGGYGWRSAGSAANDGRVERRVPSFMVGAGSAGAAAVVGAGAGVPAPASTLRSVSAAPRATATPVVARARSDGAAVSARESKSGSPVATSQEVENVVGYGYGDGHGDSDGYDDGYTDGYGHGGGYNDGYDDCDGDHYEDGSGYDDDGDYDGGYGDRTLYPAVVVLVGPPGSGKSTLASEIERSCVSHPASDVDGDQPGGWVVVNQDTLRKRKACVRVATEALGEGQPVVVDRCNFDAKQRSEWVRLAEEHSVDASNIIAVVLDVPTNVCVSRVQRRCGHPTLRPGKKAAGVVRNMAGRMSPPTEAEGFGWVVRLPYKDDRARASLLRKLRTRVMSEWL